MNIEVLTMLNDMLQSILFAVFVNGILTPKRSRLFTSVIFIAGVSVAFLLMIPFRANFKPFFMIFAMIILIYLLYRDPIRRKLIVAGVLLLFALLSEGVGIMLFLLLSNFNFNLLINFSIQRFIASVLFNMVFIMLSTIANLYINKFHGRIRRYLTVFLVGLPVVYIALIMFLFYRNLGELRDEVLLFASLGMVISVVTDLLLFLIVKTQQNILSEEKSAALMNIQHNLDYKYYELALEESQKASRVKHDVLNQLQTIYTLFLSEDAGQKKIGAEMVESLKSKLEDVRDTNYCDNRIVNILLTFKIREARAKGIETFALVVVPDDIRIDKTDLCSVFGNLMDNAIEACERAGVPGRLEIKAGIRRGYLAIKVSNSCAEIRKDEEGRLVSLKTDGRNHGLGVKIITDIVKKYDGNFEFENIENEFVSIATLRPRD